MAVRQRGNGWQVDVQWKGRRFREDQHKSEQAAREREVVIVEALKKGKPIPERSGSLAQGYATVGGLFDIVKGSRWQKPGAHQMLSSAKRFVEFVGRETSPAEAFAQASVDAFLANLAATRQITETTINKHRSAINVLCKRALSAGEVSRRPDLAWHKERKGRIRWFTDEEDALISQTLLQWGLPLVHDFFSFLIDTGARTWVEAQRLPWGDITKKPSRLVYFGDTKHGEPRSIPLTNRAWDAIERQRGNGLRGPFSAVSQEACRTLLARLHTHLPQLEDTVWYTARHTFASRLVSRGVDLYRVKTLMGHKSIVTTQIYAHLAPKTLIDAVSVLEPATPRPTLVVNNG